MQLWLKQKRLELQDTEADLYRHESAAKEGQPARRDPDGDPQHLPPLRGRQETGEAAVLEAIKSRVTDLQAIVATLQPYLLQAQAAAAAALEAPKQTALDFASRQNDGSPPARAAASPSPPPPPPRSPARSRIRARPAARAAPQSAALQSASARRRRRA